MKKLKIFFAFCSLLGATLLIYQVSFNGWIPITNKPENQHMNRDHYGDIGDGKIEEHLSPAMYYCNFPSSIEAQKAEEGIPPSSSSVLQQVQVVIRHGDRSPISGNVYKKLNVEPTYCTLKPEQNPTHPLLEKFTQTILMDYARLQKDGNAPAIFPFPNHKICGSATLSQLGVIQHIQNGEILRKAYVDQHGLLSKNLPENQDLSSKVVVFSTVTSRTVQSATAFLYGLIPDFHLDRVKINYFPSDLFRKTGCLFAKGLDKNINNVRYKTYLDRQVKNETFRKLADTFGIGDHSGFLIDSFITGFLCKGLKIPCQKNVCFTVNDLDVLMDEEEHMIKEMSEKSSFVNQSMLNLHPLLTKITNNMAAKAQNKEDSPDFVAFSGHDTTLKPLIRALGIPDYRWPRLGTRLIFELWSDKNSDEHYIRILLNGKDYTSHTHTCQSTDGTKNARNICTFEQFQSYIKFDMLKHFGVESLQQACAS